jgi:hypothetical protein
MKSEKNDQMSYFCLPHEHVAQMVMLVKVFGDIIGHLLLTLPQNWLIVLNYMSLGTMHYIKEGIFNALYDYQFVVRNILQII